MNDLKVLYVSSSSRSGSTLLEHVLGIQSMASNCGEIRRLGDFYRERIGAIGDEANRSGCTCGEKVSHCPFWQKVEKLSGLDFSTAPFTSSAGSFNRALIKLSFYLLGSRVTTWISRYYAPFSHELDVAGNCFRVYEAIAGLTGSECIVDASKIIHQFILLKILYPKRVKLIALVRDGRAVSKSMVRGRRKGYFLKGRYADCEDSVAFRAASRSWLTTVVQMGLCYLRLSSEERYFLRYEDFCDDPQKMMKAIRTHFLMRDEETSLSQWHGADHAIGGSPSRFDFSFTKIEVDSRWKESWSRQNDKNFGFMSRWVNHMLGYQ